MDGPLKSILCLRPIDSLELTAYRNISATITSLFLPETLGKPLSQTMEEAENGYSNNFEIEKVRGSQVDLKTNEAFSEL